MSSNNFLELMTPREPPHDWVTLLLLVSLAPVSIVLGVLVNVSNAVSRAIGHRGKLLPLRNPRRIQGRATKRVLITGASPLSIRLARELHALGHKVDVVSTERLPFIHHARVSRAVSKFFAFPPRQSWIDRLTFRQSRVAKDFSGFISSLIQTRSIDLWIPVTPVLAKDILDVVEIKQLLPPDSNCRILCPDPETALLLENDIFTKFVNELKSVIKSPASHEVQSRGEIHRLLGSPPMRRSFILEPSDGDEIGFSKKHSKRDSGFSEGSISDASESERDELSESLVLPLSTPDKTYDKISQIHVNARNSRVLTEVISGKSCVASTLIVDGKIRTFTAFSSSEIKSYPAAAWENDKGPLNQTLTAINPESILFQTLKGFTNNFVSALSKTTTTCLNLDFIVSELVSTSGIEQRIWAVGCDFNASDDLLVSKGATASLAANAVSSEPKSEGKPFQRASASGVYSLPRSVYRIGIVPFFQLLFFKISIRQVLESWTSLATRILSWQEELVDRRDPAPWLWFWLVEAPVYAALGILAKIMSLVRVRTA